MQTTRACVITYVTLPFHTIGCTIFIVVLIAFDSGFELCLFYVFNTPTIALIYQQHEGTVFVTLTVYIVLSLYNYSG